MTKLEEEVTQIATWDWENANHGTELSEMQSLARRVAKLAYERALEDAAVAMCHHCKNGLTIHDVRGMGPETTAIPFLHENEDHEPEICFAGKIRQLQPPFKEKV